MTLILETSGERAGIEELWERYSSTPESTNFMALAEQLRRRGCQGEAVEICSRAKASHPQYVSCRVLLGRCLMELGFRDEALRELEEVLELDRENAFSLRVMADLRMAQGDLSEAANYYRALVRINPADLDMQQKLAQVVRALEPANGDVNLPVGQEAAVRPAPSPAPGPAARPAENIEDAVEKALEELRTPESLVPAWHMEDQTAGARVGLGPSVPAGPGPDVSTEPRLSQPVRSALAQASSAQTAPPEARRHGRTPAQFFDYTSRQTEFSTFMQWVEREKGEARK